MHLRNKTGWKHTSKLSREAAANTINMWVKEYLCHPCCQTDDNIWPARFWTIFWKHSEKALCLTMYTLLSSGMKSYPWLFRRIHILKYLNNSQRNGYASLLQKNNSLWTNKLHILEWTTWKSVSLDAWSLILSCVCVCCKEWDQKERKCRRYRLWWLYYWW